MARRRHQEDSDTDQASERPRKSRRYGRSRPVPEPRAPRPRRVIHVQGLVEFGCREDTRAQPRPVLPGTFTPTNQSSLASSEYYEGYYTDQDDDEDDDDDGDLGDDRDVSAARMNTARGNEAIKGANAKEHNRAKNRGPKTREWTVAELSRLDPALVEVMENGRQVREVARELQNDLPERGHGAITTKLYREIEDMKKGEGRWKSA